jgi:hypothetical protein
MTNRNSISNSIINNHSKATLSPLVRPQALLMNPDVLLRANLAEQLSNQASLRLSALPRPTFTMAHHTTMATALAGPLQHLQQQQQYHRHLQRQLLQLQQIQKAQAKPAALPTAKDIIGMGIQVPVAAATAAPITKRPMLAPHPQTLLQQTQTQRKSLKIMQFGKPLLAPPRLASANFKPANKTLQAPRAVPPKKRTVSALSSSPSMSPLPPQCTVRMDQDTIARPLQRRKLSHPPAPRRVSPIAPSKVILSSDELDFVEAAQRLQQCHVPPGAPKRLSPMMPPRLLLKNALKPLPTLSL